MFMESEKQMTDVIDIFIKKWLNIRKGFFLNAKEQKKLRDFEKALKRFIKKEITFEVIGPYD